MTSEGGGEDDGDEEERRTVIGAFEATNVLGPHVDDQDLRHGQGEERQLALKDAVVYTSQC